MAEHSTRVWFDCDTGFDDLMALVVLAGNPTISLAGISTVVGNTTLANTTANTLATVEAFGIGVPVYAGAARPLVGEAHTIEGLLGDGGMGTIGRRLPAATVRTAEPQAAVDALVAALRGASEPMTVVGTGPLTNIALALSVAPDIAAHIERLVVMGGSATSGNHTAAAEFNAFADPEAWDVVIRSGVRLEMFGLNLTRQVLITTKHEAAIRAVGTELAQTIADHLGAYLRIRDKVNGSPMPLHDPSTAVYLEHPEWFTLEPAHVEIELAGRITRGATVCEFRVPRKAEPNAQVATAAEGEKVVDFVVSRFVERLSAIG